MGSTSVRWMHCRVRSLARSVLGQARFQRTSTLATRRDETTARFPCLSCGWKRQGKARLNSFSVSIPPSPPQGPMVQSLYGARHRYMH